MSAGVHLQKCPSILSIWTLRAKKSTMAVDALNKSDESYSSKIYPLCLMIPWYPQKIMQCRGHCQLGVLICTSPTLAANDYGDSFLSLVNLFGSPFGVHRKDWEENLQEIFPVKQSWQKTVTRFGDFISPIPASDLIRLGNFEPHISSRFPLQKKNWSKSQWLSCL